MTKHQQQQAATIAVIGGTGLYDMGPAEPATIATPYGEAEFFRVRLDGEEVIFLPRHGRGHLLPPHRVNYRAHIWALRALGAREALATQAVGSLNPRMAPGDLVLLSQFIDWTKGRPSTFFDGEDGVVRHVDVTLPYCARMTARLLRASEPLGKALHLDGVYACTEGPRFETAAEIRALRTLGADVVGMTNVPEVVLAREAGLCYAAVCVVCNWAAGMTGAPLTQQEVLDIMNERAGALRDLIARYVALPDEGACACACAELGFADFLPKLL